MEYTFSSSDIRRMRLRSQLLEPRFASNDVAEIVAKVFGIQAQDNSAAQIGIFARSRGLNVEDVKACLYLTRSIVRTWCMRGTLHYLTAKDVPWLLFLFGPTFVTRGRNRLKQLGFDDLLADRAVELIQENIRKYGSQTRLEVSNTLANAGFSFDPKGQAPYHLIRRASLLGNICEVTPKENKEAYGLLHEWMDIDVHLDRKSALRILASRYLSAYQPASLKDFSTWSKLPMKDLRTAWVAIEPFTTTITDGNETMKILTKDMPDGLEHEESYVNLLPAFDSFMLGYSNRSHTISKQNENQIWPGGGIIRPTVIHDGKVVATWKIRRKGEQSVILIDPIGTPLSEIESLLIVEIHRMGNFLGTTLDYEIN
ncbi:MAG: winged helix DNA-binding domain-containing protein [Candidatus Thorarchaeota archaeon]|jgi:hypothetical protein